MAKSGAASIGTRVSLLEGIKDPENQKRWTEFNDRYAGFIRGVAIRNGIRRNEADEIVQSVLIEVSKKIGKFSYDPTKGRFRSWLAQTAWFKCCDAFKKQARDRNRIEIIKPSTIKADKHTTIPLREYSETEHDRIVEDEWNRAVLSATRDRVRAMVRKEQYELYDAYALKEWPIDKVVKAFGVTANMVYLAKSKVGKIFEEQGRLVLAQMESPTLPPEHPQA